MLNEKDSFGIDKEQIQEECDDEDDDEFERGTESRDHHTVFLDSLQKQDDIEVSMGTFGKIKENIEVLN